MAKRKGRKRHIFPKLNQGVQHMAKRARKKFDKTMEDHGVSTKPGIPKNPEDFTMLNYLDSLKNNGMGFDIKGKPIVHEECWDSEIEVITSCGACKNVIPLTISQLAMAKINALMVKYPKIEWLAYLLGTEYHIDDIIVPEQVVTAVRVDDIEPVDVPTIGVIHSHHGMGNGFSGVDDAYINQNHDISLCISHGGINGQVRVKTACDKFVIVKATVTQVVPGFDVKGFIDDAVTKITAKTYTYSPDRDIPACGGVGGGGVGGHPANMNIDLNLGIVDLANTMKNDIELANEEDYDVNDLYAYSEIIKAVCVGKDSEQFVTLYNAFLDEDRMPEEAPDEINIPLELLDEMDGAFDTLTNPEKNALIHLNKAITELIHNIANDAFEDMKDNTDFTRTGDDTEPEEGWEGLNSQEMEDGGADEWDGKTRPSVNNSNGDNLWNTAGNA